MPQLDQNGCIDYGSGKGKINYARIEDIDAQIRPIYSGAGFSVSWNSEPVMEGKMVKVQGTFSCHGHNETREMTGPVDNSGGKNGIQGVASSVAYLKRQISKQQKQLPTLLEQLLAQRVCLRCFLIQWEELC
jgi:hypothetical protein